MTTLDKNPVYRLTRAAYPVLHHKCRQIVVGLEPGDVLTFREKFRRGKWTLPIDSAFKIAIRNKVESDRRARVDAKRRGA